MRATDLAGSLREIVTDPPQLFMTFAHVSDSDQSESDPSGML
jgi:hypothetical protein